MFEVEDVPEAFYAERHDVLLRENMIKKIVALLLILTIVSTGLLLVASGSANFEGNKGGFGAQSFETFKGKPTKPSGGIATGEISMPTGARFAIIIGINYEGSGSDLSYCVNDAMEFQTALISVGWRKSSITLLVEADATQSAILNAIASVSEAAGPDDEVVFFYSGHGSISNYDVDGDGERRDECIIPVELTRNTLIWDGTLADAFANCESQRMMFYFDSCYSGGMTDLAGPGRLICMACGENQLSLESSVWENGQFTYYFVDQGMKQGLADTNDDAYVTFEEAFDFAKANCQRQTPVASDGFTNDMVP